MSRQVPIQVWLPPTTVQEVRAFCLKHGLALSELLRSLVMEACDLGLEDRRLERELERIASDLNFTAVALDALLAGHPDPQLRTRAHEAFARKEERRRASSSTDEGGK